MSSTTMNIIPLNAQIIPIKHVTVFTDRAEIDRMFTVSLQPGLNEIQLENVAHAIEQNSIRVDGTGVAVIHEVQFKCKPTKFEDVDTPKLRELTDELKKVEEEYQTNKDLNSIYEARLEAIDTAIKNIGNTSSGKDNGLNSFLFDETTETSIEKLFDYHEKKALDIKSKNRIVNEKMHELEEKINLLKREINQLRNSGQNKNIISIQLENQDQENPREVELNVSYQVYGARWTPSYDIRVKTLTEENELKLVYYGNISQNTGEDWNDVELQLSTATPGIGGELPKLGTTIVEFYRPSPVIRAQSSQPMMAFGSAKRMMRNAAPEMMECATLDHSTAISEENVLSTTFNIPVKKSIPSDLTEHKVTITSEKLKTLLHYRCVPKKDTNAFLTAIVINNSDYPLLPGNATVYLNNSMSANIRLKTTSCNEKFECPLGVDKSVKVIYKPTHQYQTQVGTFSKVSSSTNEQRIIIKNNKKAEPILITLSEPIPKSTDEKIKVKLASPELKQQNGNTDNDDKFKLPDVGTKLDDLHNLQWTAVIDANKEQEFLIKWIVEYPPSEKLVYSERNERE